MKKRNEVESLGETVRRARASRRWSQAELSRRSGVSQANISVLETGKSDPRASTLAALAAALDLELILLPKRERPWIQRTVDGPTSAATTSVLADVLVPDPDEESDP